MQAETDKINILIVDDNVSNLLALDAILQAPDRNLVKAASGDEALRYLLESDVAVILLDVYMPGIDGLETAALIRGREKSRDIPIIFLTADSTGNRHIARGYSLGAVDYILKPIEPDILRSKVAVFVELYRKTEEVKRQAALLHEKNLELENANLERLGMLIELGQRLASEREPARVLETFCQAAREIVGAGHAGVGLIDAGPRSGDGGGAAGHDAGPRLMHFFRSDLDGARDGYDAPAPAPGEGALGRLIAGRRPLRLSDAAETLRADDLPSSRRAAQSFLGTPIFDSGAVAGWLYLTDKLGADEFSEADERLAVTLATQVAVFYENARLYAEAERAAAALRQEVTERKAAEEERARMLVREQAARAEAEQANRTKDEFLATLSHELRTPLTAILGWSHLLRSDKLNKEHLDRALETIERNARSQSQLIDDLLDVSRIITGKLRLDVRPVSLGAVMEAAIDSVRPAADAKNIRFEVSLDEGVGQVTGDANRLQQVVWNLFSNAVKFTPEGGRVEVRVARAGSHAEITVSDTGAGIEPRFLPFIFDRFRQADGSTTRRHGGLGLGLSIVRHLVELHGGTIGVHSEGADQGSTFTVTLPLREASPKSSPAASAADPYFGGDGLRAPSRAAALDGLRILLVDDEEDTRELLTTVLSKCGAVVRGCGSAAEAMTLLEAWGPDLLISDIGMPDEDGYSFIRRVREVAGEGGAGAASGAGREQLPAIALTAYAGSEDRARAISAGFQAHLAKPIEPEALITAIAAIAGHRRSAA